MNNSRTIAKPSQAALPLTRRAGLLGAAAVLLAGCNPGHDLPELVPYQPASYRLGGGDQIRLIVFGEDQLTGEFRVDDEGTIAVPLLGEVKAVGFTTAQLASTVAAALKGRNFLRNPSVVVEVLAYRPIFVLGEVAKPGQYPYQPGMTVVTAVAVAGGFTYRAVRDYVSLVRTTTNVSNTGKAFQGSFVAPGDVINVLERFF